VQNTGNLGAYACKALLYSPNTQIDRVNDGAKFNYLPMGSYHPGGVNFLLADGSVAFLPGSLDLTTYQNMATCSGGEIANLSR
jgi:prepilin-type processing-associated H-X9-DG protein